METQAVSMLTQLVNDAHLWGQGEGKDIKYSFDIKLLNTEAYFLI